MFKVRGYIYIYFLSLVRRAGRESWNLSQNVLQVGERREQTVPLLIFRFQITPVTMIPWVRYMYIGFVTLNALVILNASKFVLTFEESRCPLYLVQYPGLCASMWILSACIISESTLSPYVREDKRSLFASITMPQRSFSMYSKPYWWDRLIWSSDSDLSPRCPSL